MMSPILFRVFTEYKETVSNQIKSNEIIPLYFPGCDKVSNLDWRVRPGFVHIVDPPTPYCLFLGKGGTWEQAAQWCQKYDASLMTFPSSDVSELVFQFADKISSDGKYPSQM